MSRQSVTNVTGGRNAESPTESESENGHRGCLGACTRETKNNTLVLKTDDFVFCLAALDDGRFASGGGLRGDENWPIIIWSTDGGKEVARLEPTGPVRCLAALAGGRLASCCERDRSIIIWNLADGTHTTLKGHNSNIRCLAALGRDRLASGSWDKSIIIWNVADRKRQQLATLKGHTDWVLSLAALGGDRLASGSRDKSIDAYRGGLGR